MHVNGGDDEKMRNIWRESFTSGLVCDGFKVKRDWRKSLSLVHVHSRLVCYGFKLEVEEEVIESRDRSCA
jgi:hypothetical protein